MTPDRNDRKVIANAENSGVVVLACACFAVDRRSTNLFLFCAGAGDCIHCRATSPVLGCCACSHAEDDYTQCGNVWLRRVPPHSNHARPPESADKSDTFQRSDVGFFTLSCLSDPACPDHPCHLRPTSIMQQAYDSLHPNLF